MYPLFESVCVINGAIQNKEYHIARFLKSYTNYFKQAPTYSLFKNCDLSSINKDLKYKLKICYNKTEATSYLTEYNNKIPCHLQLIEDHAIHYHLKFYNRKKLDQLHTQRTTADDVLIVKNGFITDSSYANILFKKEQLIVTPKQPLLEGTCRARLIDELKIAQINISIAAIKNYTHFQLVNAMNDFDEARWVAIKQIKLPK